MEINEVKDRWNKYITELFADKRDEPRDIQNDEGQETKEEIEAALKMVKNGKVKA